MIFTFAAVEVGEKQWQFDVSLCGEHGQKIVKLEDKTDVPRAPAGQLAIGQLIHPLAIDAHRAFSWPIQPPDQVEQRALA